MTFAEQNPLPEDGAVTPEAAPEAAPEVAPETAPAAEPEVTTSPEVDWNQRVEAWGGEQSIEDAIAIAQALQDEDGVRALVQEGLKHLGYDPNILDAQGNPVEPPEPEDPDRLVTAAEVEARIRQIQESQAQAESQATDARAQAAVLASVESLSLTDDDEVRAVLSFAQKYASPDERDPGVLEAAIKAGHADYIKTLEEASKRYVQQRADANNSVPTPVTSGGAPSGDEVPQPKNLEEARIAARRYLANTNDV